MVVATSVERHDPMAASAGGEQEVERRGDVPTPRKRAASADAVGEREAKRTRSPCPSEALPVLSPPAEVWQMSVPATLLMPRGM